MSGVRGKGASRGSRAVEIMVAYWQATRILFRERPDVVLSMGGYVAFPGGMMAVLWGKPLVVHEPGAVAGITNRALAVAATRVVVGMEGAFDRPIDHPMAKHIPKPQPQRVQWLGTPVREEIAAVATARQRFRRTQRARCACWWSAAASARRP
jgi:UDP-N-acetylglucosamine--N-acetylmuramyl-(pentapeptide) pyrophosphoryl-undecaprenol N-acetylglucosamine transferase